jgi:hypothetical protein
MSHYVIKCRKCGAVLKEASAFWTLQECVTQTIQRFYGKSQEISEIQRLPVHIRNFVNPAPLYLNQGLENWA